MCSTRNFIHRCTLGLAIGLGSTALLAGCQRAYVERVEPLSSEPVIEDDAMRLRQWTQTSALYPNGAVDAGPTAMTWEPRRHMEDYRYYYGDIGVFFANLFTIPYRYYHAPPWSRQTYRGVWIEPTYHAMPPLPPEPSMPAPIVIEETPDEPPAPMEVPPADAPTPRSTADDPADASTTQPG